MPLDLSALHTAGIDASAREPDREPYRRDLWPRTTLELARGRLAPSPAAVAWPTSSAQVRTLVDWAVDRGVPLVPFGAGSGVCGAAAGREGSLAVDTKRMDAVLDFDPSNHTVRVQPGILGQHLEDVLEPVGWMTAHSPSSIMCSTVGGYIAARSAGQFSSRYGVFDDMLLAASAECPSQTLRTGQWTPAGEEDLLPVLCGSEGALGIITECLVRIAPLPQRRWIHGFAFPDLHAAWEAMRSLMQAELWPSVLRLYDPVDTRIGGKTSVASGSSSILADLRDAVLSSPTLKQHALALPLSLPGLVNRLANTMRGEALLIVGFEGPESTVQAAVDAADNLLGKGRPLGSEPGSHWFDHRHDVSYKLAPFFAAGAFADTMEVATTWSRLQELHESVRAALGRRAVVMAHFSHAYREGCSIYFSFAGRGRTDVYDKTWRDALAAARAAGGTVTHHHGVGSLKAVEAAREAGAAVRAWRAHKERLDPSNLMNPGRLFPEEVQVEPGPPPPTEGPVFEVDRTSLLAEVDPDADPSAIQEALAEQGLQLRHLPDRPFGDWLTSLERGVLPRWETPLFAVQARFEDGTSTRVGVSPRSAAGPDLRWTLLRHARAELVQVPVRPLEEMVIELGTDAPDIRELRPCWTSGNTCGFHMEARPLARLAGESCPTQQVRHAPPVSPHRSPVR